jgi:hypothetical protein
VDTETARIFFGDSAQDIFGTVLHEDYHWYNALDAEGARTLQEHALEYLAKSSGYESLDEMIRAKLRDYSAQSLTYEQAAEELVADAWRGIFDSEESFRRWVTFQRGQAEKNAGKSICARRERTWPRRRDWPRRWQAKCWTRRPTGTRSCGTNTPTCMT